MDQQEPTIVEKLEAEAATAKAAVEQAQKDLAEMTAARDAMAAELEQAKAVAAEQAGKLEALAGELNTAKTETAQAKADTQATLELAAKAEERAKLAEKTLAMDPAALKALGVAGAMAVAGTSGADGKDPETWAEAVKVCGGDYVKARRTFPAVWEKQFKK